MSTVAFNSRSPKSSIDQGFLMGEWMTNPSGDQSLQRLTRRGRLARTLVVLSLTVVIAAGFAARSGAGDHVSNTASYINVVVPGGATLWSVAAAYSNGDITAMVEAIREANNLTGYDIAAGARLRIPTA